MLNPTICIVNTYSIVRTVRTWIMLDWNERQYNATLVPHTGCVNELYFALAPAKSVWDQTMSIV